MAAALSNDISYESILARTASYNRQLQVDKQSRLPFLDNATGIAQRPCLLQRKDDDRYLGSLNDKVFIYRPNKWKKTKKNVISHSSVVRSADQYSNNARAGNKDIQSYHPFLKLIYFQAEACRLKTHSGVS